MRIKLENIGMLENADVKLDGLTVIVGENDTGKSTVGKALYIAISSDLMARYYKDINPDIDESRKKNANRLIQFIFKNQISKNGCIEVKHNDILLSSLEIKNNRVVSSNDSGDNWRDYLDITVIETPLIWSMTNFFNIIGLIEKRDRDAGIGSNFEYPPLLYNLHTKLYLKKEFERIEFNTDAISKVINGRFEKDELNKYHYVKTAGNGERIKIELENTATGIKMFGLLQALFDNGYINKKNIFIFDEPEVHLHPKWQLDFAEIISKLASKGVLVIVNSHSPYMIEALKVYSDKCGISDKTNFYLAEKNIDGLTSTITDVTNDLEPIFAKLAEPYRLFDKIAMDNAFA